MKLISLLTIAVYTLLVPSHSIKSKKLLFQGNMSGTYQAVLKINGKKRLVTLNLYHFENYTESEGVTKIANHTGGHTNLRMDISGHLTIYKSKKGDSKMEEFTFDGFVTERYDHGYKKAFYKYSNLSKYSKEKSTVDDIENFDFWIDDKQNFLDKVRLKVNGQIIDLPKIGKLEDKNLIQSACSRRLGLLTTPKGEEIFFGLYAQQFRYFLNNDPGIKAYTNKSLERLQQNLSKRSSYYKVAPTDCGRLVVKDFAVESDTLNVYYSGLLIKHGSNGDFLQDIQSTLDALKRPMNLSLLSWEFKGINNTTTPLGYSSSYILSLLPNVSEIHIYFSPEYQSQFKLPNQPIFIAHVTREADKIDYQL